jgi:hypothetical protein
MKKLLFITIALLTLNSCKKEEKFRSLEETNSMIDSLELRALAEKKVDSLLKYDSKKRYTDTTGLSSAPVKVISAKLIEEEYSNYKNIKIVYKNVSNKKIQAIRFDWYGENAFNEPADMGNPLTEGVGSGFTDDILRPGKSTTGVWNIYSKDGKKVLSARPYEVAFTDGTKWELKQ